MPNRWWLSTFVSFDDRWAVLAMLLIDIKEFPEKKIYINSRMRGPNGVLGRNIVRQSSITWISLYIFQTLFNV